MALDGSTPPPCASDIFKDGSPVAAIADERSVDTERWVQELAKRAEARVDWHYTGGIAQVLHLGDAESRMRVDHAIDELTYKLKGTVIQRYGPGEAGLFRRGVTPVPEGARMVDTTSGKNVFLA